MGLSRARYALSEFKNTALRRAVSILGHLQFKAESAGRQGAVEIDIEQRMGMGALISHALRLHAWADRESFDVRITSTCPLYSTGDDVFGQFFEQSDAVEGARRMGGFAARWLVLRGAPETLPLNSAQALMARHFVPNTLLDAAIDEASCGNRNFDLAIHFRGTDKHRESGEVGHDVMLRALSGFLAGSDKAKRVVLATDDAEFSRIVRSTWSHAEWVSFDLGTVPDGAPRHFSALTPADKAKEALVNMYLLAGAPVCVRTSSYMSSISRLINPALRTITINKTYNAAIKFPEREILAAEASERAA